MTGTGESLADTHIHINRHMEAGGATLGFTVLWYYPVLLPDRRPAARREWEGGESHSTSRLERDARKKAQPSLSPFFFQTLRLPTLCKHVTLKQTCSPQTIKWYISMSMLNFISTHKVYHSSGAKAYFPGSYTVRTTLPNTALLI